jgi:predicted aminopeptidase
MGLLIAAAALLFGYGAAYVTSEDVRYLTHAGEQEMRILYNRQPMHRLANDPHAPPALRAQAKMVLDVRAFADTMGLAVNETYTTYSDVGRDTLLLVLTASPRTCICPVTWKYPVAGRVPYKGFFNFDQARRASDEYAAKGFDVNLRPSAAFSTLGWFNDPLLSTALTTDSVELATLVFHEIAHNSLWVKGATDFNESFAQWVGYGAAALFFYRRGDTVQALRAKARWRDEQTFADYYHLLVNRLDSLYALKLPAAQNDSGRAVIARWSRDTLVNGFGPLLHTYTVNKVVERPINNAALLGVRLYRTNLELFDQLQRANKNDLIRSIDLLREMEAGAVGDVGYARLRALTRGVPPAAPADSSH